MRAERRRSGSYYSRRRCGLKEQFKMVPANQLVLHGNAKASVPTTHFEGFPWAARQTSSVLLTSELVLLPSPWRFSSVPVPQQQLVALWTVRNLCWQDKMAALEPWLLADATVSELWTVAVQRGPEAAPERRRVTADGAPKKNEPSQTLTHSEISSVSLETCLESEVPAPRPVQRFVQRRV